ncbi:serine hydroxymethyltransferase [Candidatus Uhrbacteria bacterium CG_4_10_14_0_8_um_filter_58_22]|uniref:Serine hydroxymethyltransferase n=1 Tax=Candidatus Uhrbacteria bacterium CG_4_10_14_0_8_um_filter_58_22 TaxID=1975029 RepID=A0A2M7QC27_9BACT|nr:MAG: serine hydroxymethyltransferase [Parcubacteria group bacterium CG1_02_58_44]PIY63333.1 MAG: serine hydroxymethyltransferase [Candidatus Uhrbacteria bacterium CG_4_10_14_0_8_um_filter_58_22]
MLEHLRQQDPEVAATLAAELSRQRNGLEMIASENSVSEAVLEALGTVLTNKYAEGYPAKRYYGGNEHVDVAETLAIERARRLFGAEHANVQPHCGSQANMAAYFALAEPGDKIMALDLAHGGHLTHGSRVNFSGKLYSFIPYGVSRETETLDLDQISELARRERPKVILAGYTAYPRSIDFAGFRKIADEVGAYLMVDMAHIAGLVATGLHPDPVAVADVVTSTTHKTLRGPRGGLILCRREDRLRPDDKKNLARRIDSAVFPGIQGGPLMHVIAAKAVAFGEALRPDFTDYQRQVIANARELSAALVEEGLRVVSGGTDNHLVLVDLTPVGVFGQEASTRLDAVGIHTNKNLIPFDERKPTDPSGLRLGTPVLTTRGLHEPEMRRVASLIARTLRSDGETELDLIRSEVRNITEAFPLYADLDYGHVR